VVSGPEDKGLSGYQLRLFHSRRQRRAAIKGKNARGQIVLMIRFVHEFSAARVTPYLEESRH